MNQEPELKTRLVTAAGKLLKKVPVQSLSLREVARAAGVSQAAPYRHFKDKEALLAAISCQGFTLLRVRMLSATGNATSVEDAFYKMGHAYLKFGEDHGEHLRLMFGPFVTPSAEHPDLFRAAKLSFLALVALIQNCQKAGIVGPGDAFQRAMNTWMAVHGFTILYIDHRCEWLGIAAKTASPRMDVFLRDMLLGMKKPLPIENESERLQVISIDPELLVEAGVSFQVAYGIP
jgi:AcrR family transcriptional regulator